MCGFTGFLSASGSPRPSEWGDLLTKMGHSIRHRGPDDGGIWYDADAGIGLSHRRLSILDLSPAGHQPMASATSRYVIAFNGEIYNHLTIRKSLEQSGASIAWRGHSDTETLLASFDAWGIENTVKKCIGMFAFAVWDLQDRTLTLCRDRMGEKPLYYGWQGDTFLFGSELKSLKVHPAFKAEVSRDSLTLLLRKCYIPAPFSIYQDIQKLPPGTLLTVSLHKRTNQPEKYWDASHIVENGINQPYQGTPDEAIKTLESLLKDAVLQQMISDVPLGAFLSGGIDSSLIAALMQAQSNRPIQTFTIGFNEAAFNEATHAKAVAKHLGTDHTELYVSSQQALDVIPLLPSLYCEPFADSSQIPTYLVSKLARQSITVSLSGDAGDELFGGYDRYFISSKFQRSISMFPSWLRRISAAGITSLSPETWNTIFLPIRPLLPEKLAYSNIGHKLHKGAQVVQADSTAQLYRLLLGHWMCPEKIVLGASEPLTVWSNEKLLPKTDSFFHQMMAIDMLSYLPNDILVKLDRAAMGVSLETRVPLLDHRIVEFAWQLPLSYKVRDGVGKWALRQVLYKYVPRKLIERPKMGFGVPIEIWLRGPLRDWAEALLDEARLRQEGYFDPAPIRQKWEEHVSGHRNWSYPLWDILMFQAWLETEK